MANDSAVDRSFTEEFNRISELFKQDKLEECITRAKAFLTAPAIPQYHSMKTAVLLGSIVGDWFEAVQYHHQAEVMWRVTRNWHPEGQDAQVDAAMAEIRISLDALEADLDEERPIEYIDKLEDAIEPGVASEEEAMEGKTALAGAEDDDPEALAEGDKSVVESMENMRIEKEVI